MKKLIALILAVLLLSVSCIALADEEKPNGFEVTFNFEKEMRFDGLKSINAFLASCPLSKLECSSYQTVWGLVYYNDEAHTFSHPIEGFSSITLYGEKDDSADLNYYQLDVAAYLKVDGETWESYMYHWLSEHPGATIAWHIYNHVISGGYNCQEAIICYYQPSL